MSVSRATCRAIITTAAALPLGAQFVHNVRSFAAPPGLYTTVQHGSELLAVDQSGFTWSWSATTTTWTPLSAPAVPTFNGSLFTTRSGVAFAYQPGTNQASQWTGTAWATVTLANAVSFRGASGFAALPNGDVVLFGGRNGSTILGDTWRLTGSVWTQLAPATAPSAREWPAMATDGTGLILFGGRNSTTTFGDTWRFDGARWTFRGAGGPPARSLAAFAHRPSTNSITLIGGIDALGGSLADAWVFAFGSWARVPPAQVIYQPIQSVFLGAALNPASDEIVAYDVVTLVTVVSSVSGYRSVGGGCVCDSQTARFILGGAGQTTLGSTFAIAFFNYAPGNPLFLMFDTTLATPPFQIPGLPLGCLQQIANVSGSVLVSLVPPTPPPVLTVPVSVPVNQALIGVRIVYQGLQWSLAPFLGCASDVLDVRLGRP